MSDICIPNIGPRERRRRLILGIAMFGIVGLVAALLVFADAPRAWRLFALFPAWVGSIGVLQAREKT